MDNKSVYFSVKLLEFSSDYVLTWVVVKTTIFEGIRQQQYPLAIQENR